LYWRKKKREELLKPLEMSSDTISNLLWNPANPKVLQQGSAETTHDLSAPKVPQPASLQAIRTRKAMQLQILRSKGNSQLEAAGSAHQPGVSEDEQLRVSFSDSDGAGSTDFADETSTGYVSEYGSNTPTMFTSSAAEPDLQYDTRF
jgi:hypothetical protein